MRWYVIQVMTGDEYMIRRACEQCVQESGEEIFIPTYTRSVRRRGEPVSITDRLFPGYIFFATDDVNSLFLRLKRVQEMTRLLRSADEITPIEPDEQEALEQLCGPEHNVAVSTGIIRGGNVIITAGPLKHLRGKILKINRHRNLATVQLRFMGRNTTAKVGLEILSKT